MIWLPFVSIQPRRRPWGFSVVDLDQMEEAAHRVQEETDDWVAAEEPPHERVWKTAPLAESQRTTGSWWGSVDRPFSGALGTYIRNLMDSAGGQSWPVLGDQALGHVLKECIQKDRQDVHAYRLTRVGAGGTGHLPAADWGVIVEWADLVTRGRRIGEPILNAIDFGERLRLTSIIQEHLACGDQHDINQCALIHLSDAMEGAIRKDRREFLLFPRGRFAIEYARGGNHQRKGNGNAKRRVRMRCRDNVRSPRCARRPPRQGFPNHLFGPVR